jgi:predicted transcriptional regulator
MKRRYKRRALSLTDNTNTTLLDHINRSPGIRYSELKRETGIADGKLEYHLKILEDLKQIKVSRYPTRKSTRYYPLDKSKSNDDFRIIEYSQSTGAREIVQLLLNKDQCYFADIVQLTKRVPSTISHHLSRLKKGGVITQSKNGKHKTYRLKNKDKIARLMNNIGK